MEETKNLARPKLFSFERILVLRSFSAFEGRRTLWKTGCCVDARAFSAAVLNVTAYCDLKTY